MQHEPTAYDLGEENSAKALRVEEMDAGPSERQINDWNIHNDHLDGLELEL